jgi:catecholate siderophore receptor
MAVGTLVIYTAAGTTTVALAAENEAPLPADQTITLPLRRYNIRAGSLATVIAEFSRTAGVEVTALREDMLTVESPGVAGLFTPEEALRQLLHNTGIDFQSKEGGKFVLDLRAVNSSVEVLGQATPASPKYTEPLRDIPQTITVINRDVIEQQGATTLRDVLRNVSGLTVAAGEGGTPAGDNLTLRGFSARNDIFVDGSRDLGPQSRDPFNIEQVDVVKGPGSALAGRGSSGGTINMVSKTPNLNRAFGGSVMLGSAGLRRISADVNVPMERSAFRLNTLWHESGVPGRDVVHDQRWGVAPSLTMGLGTPNRLTLSYYKLRQDNIPDYGIPWVPAANTVLPEYRDRPAPVPRNTFYGLRNRDFEKLNSDAATIRFERDFSDGVTLRNQFRYGRSTRDSLATPPRFLNADSTIINREARSWITRDGIYDNQTDFQARFRTGALEHAVVTGVSLVRENNVRRSRTTSGVSLTTLLNPNPNDPFETSDALSPSIGNVTGNTQAAYAFDTVKFGRYWEATGGARWERFDVDGVTTADTPVNRVDRMTSVRGGLVYKPVQSGSIYASYGTSLNPSLEGLSYNIANTDIEPEKTYTLELGSKWDVAGGRLMLSGAVFRVDKTNARTPGLLPDDPPQVLNGKQRVKGFELGATGGITRNWKVFAGYTFLNSRIAESNNPLEEGRVFLNTPRNSLSVWTTYQLRRLTLGGGPRFIGRRSGNNTNTRTVDSFWTVDALASYPITRRVDLRVNAYNLNNAYFFDRLGGGHVVPGAARAVAVSANLRF